jgi:hypothetical protein
MAAGSTYTKIASTTLGSAAASVTFSSIAATYTDLVLVSQVRSARAATDDSLYIQVNGDTATNYSVTDLKGRFGVASSSRASSQTKIIAANNIVGASATAGIYDTVITNFMNYSNSTTNKTVLSRGSSANEEVAALVNLYRSTSAITQIVIYCASANIASGSTFNLYGITAA